MKTAPVAWLRARLMPWLTTTLTALCCSTAAAAPCDAPAHREFDFWLGHWQVHTPDGKLVGHNRIESAYGGCVVHERYQATGAYRGENLNSFDAGRRVWHQTWVDNGGLLLLLEGGLRDGRMVLEGRNLDAAGQVLRHRISWSPQPGGKVRQQWQTAKPDADWTTAFDGLYSRVDEGQPAPPAK